MQTLAKAVEQVLARNKDLLEHSQKITDELSKTVERMAASLSKATHDIKVTVAGSKTFTGTITEIDKVTGTCKIMLENDEEHTRIPAEIWDPCFKLEKDNVYIVSFSRGLPVTFTAKSQLDNDGNIFKFFISDAKLAA